MSEELFQCVEGRLNTYLLSSYAARTDERLVETLSGPYTCQLSLPTKLCSRLNPANALTGWGVWRFNTHQLQTQALKTILQTCPTSFSGKVAAF